MAADLGIDTHVHALRHDSATELLAGGVDLRTVAGRLDHAGGGATTLKVYAAWLAGADTKAADLIASPGRLKICRRAGLTSGRRMVTSSPKSGPRSPPKQDDPRSRCRRRPDLNPSRPP